MERSEALGLNAVLLLCAELHTDLLVDGIRQGPARSAGAQPGGASSLRRERSERSKEGGRSPPANCVARLRARCLGLFLGG